MAFQLPKTTFAPTQTSKVTSPQDILKTTQKVGQTPINQAFLASKVTPYIFNQPTTQQTTQPVMQPTQPTQTITQPMGVQAKSPTQNIKPTQTTLPPNLQAPIVAPIQTPVNTQIPTANQSTPQVNPNTGIFGQLIGSLASTAQGQQPINPYIAEQARKIADIQSNIGQVREQSARAQGAYTTGGLTVPVAMGRAQEIAQTAAAQEQGLGIQQQAQQGLLQNILAGQQQQQAGLQQAAQLAQPQISGYGQAQYSPFGGTLSGSQGAGIAPTDPFYQTMQSYAQLLANNQGSAIPSSITSNPVLQAQVVQMAQQINPNFNYNVATGAGTAQQQVAQTAGTAGQQAAQQVFNQSYSDYNTLQNATQNIDQFGGLLTQTMAQGGINPSDVKFANQKLADIRNQLSSASQAVYDNTLASLRSRVSGLLAAGGSEVPSAITADAVKILDGSLPLSSLSQVLGRIQQEGQVLLQNKAQIVNQNWDKINQTQNAARNTTGATPPGLF